ncbi:ATP-dependent helicase [Thiosulfatimonas sediminis]|uniref:DNA 3'-5' helicase n=1 Tax=Thiosulfatimonas sediminis TaxID=2675054 RepID=A0A6F8PWQ3_9GAMM|nr:UvrD-helicase domain-containing protein [Thiosulfatimonas sediminis]BBP46573.1 ATP-dependent helicase [Thiosulfatimonas sediminis]
MNNMNPTYPDVQQIFALELDGQLDDAQARLQAIDPFHSFIVQAPAGSGKTSLLTQRYLGLLSQVKAPEQIVAMTFTKKAAAEMRERIMKALQLGAHSLAEDAGLVERNTWKLARKALQQDQNLGWQLLNNPNRLRIKTIDGFNSFLVGQMPVLSKMGTQLKLSDKPQQVYQEAVRQVLQEEDFVPLVEPLLMLVNGRYTRAENLLCAMLAKRDQWMDHLQYVDSGAREELQNALKEIVLSELRQHRQSLSKVEALLAEVCDIADYAQHNDQPDLVNIASAWPFAENDTESWRVLAAWVLTKDSKKVRARLTKNEGFPTGKGLAKERKEQMVQVLQGISDADDLQGTLVSALAALKDLPDPHYTDQQWQILQSLMQLLKICAGYLKLVFQSRAEADFIEIAQSASQALGHKDEPTDLALQLDYQIQHLLIDEFQDTSSKQFELVEKLVAGWQEDDARTLFIVGDPMQSIYRFREAEVANFLKAWQGRLGNVALQPLNLTVNFRSQKQVVDWVNHTFQKVLPKNDDMAKGAVKFSKALTQRDDLEPAVFHHWECAGDGQQSERIVEFIVQRLSELRQQEEARNEALYSRKIAILGRSRSHLMVIAQQLKKSAIAFRAVELEALKDRQEVQDCLALSRAFLHLGDRAAWIALLRSPLVGLNLHDLHALIADKPYKTVVFCLEQALQPNGLIDFSRLSAEGQARIMQTWPILQNAIAQLGVHPFSKLIKECWLMLDGALSVENSVALQNVASYFEVLAQFDHDVLGMTLLESLVETLYASADASEASQQIEIMTMHKSKGLEFDTVILPGLNKKPRNKDPELVSWFQFMDTKQKEHLVLAPIDQKGQEKSYLSRLLTQFESHKQQYELGRLLYVACTRAKVQLHLFAELKIQQDTDVTLFAPTKSSMLEALWPAVQTSVVAAIEQQLNSASLDDKPVAMQAPSIAVARLPLQRKGLFAYLAHLDRPQLLKNKNKPDDAPSIASVVTQGVVPETPQPEYWQAENLVSKAAGNLVHKVLEQWARTGIEHVADMALQKQTDFYLRWLQQQGLDAAQTQRAWQKVASCLKNAYENPQMRWALSQSRQHALSEYALQSLNAQGEIEQHIIDYTLIDDDGVRWIIDYKTSACEVCDSAAQRAEFIEMQQQYYAPQLHRYAELFRAQENRPQKLVLYLAAIDVWTEVANHAQ